MACGIAHLRLKADAVELVHQPSAARRHSVGVAGSVDIEGMRNSSIQRARLASRSLIDRTEHCIYVRHVSPPSVVYRGHWGLARHCVMLPWSPVSSAARGQAMNGVAFKLARDSLQANQPSQRFTRFRRIGYQRWLLLRSQVNVYYFWEKRWFFVAMLVGFIFLQLPTPEGLTYHGQVVLAMSLVATMLFITEPVPLPTVALLIVIGQVLLLGLDPTYVAQSLMTDSVLFIMGSLMLAVAIVKQKLDQRIAWLIVRFTGTNAYWVTFGITSVCGFIAAFIGEHTVAAMMLPVGVRLITLTSADPRKVHNLAAVILFSISYGCSIAGIATPSGGARNAIMIGYWQQLFFNPVDPQSYRFLMDYVTWMIYAFPMFLLRLPFVTAVLFFTFKPELTDMARAIARLRTQVMMQGPSSRPTGCRSSFSP
jgi:solute carrier family 13 (sodium-dependent dicarboxylate transporter), member 2/3/5